ncbi:MAG: hypothetical protein QOF60_2024 [Actinomycetota bacterium]|jgi:hypothetical protein|nr:hypothetical protein [Actinomycetota bacterium]
MPSVGALALAVVVALGTAGCGGLHRSGYQFVRSPKTGTYLKVPDDWTVFSQREIERYLAKAAPERKLDGFQFITTFDAGEHPSVAFDPASTAPAGVVRVRPLSPDERDIASFNTIRNELFDMQGTDGAEITPTSTKEVQQDGVRGQRIVFNRTDPLLGTSATIDQTILVDKTTSRLYLLVVGCRPDCYERNKKAIDTVVTSLTIKER